MVFAFDRTPVPDAAPARAPAPVLPQRDRRPAEPARGKAAERAASETRQRATDPMGARGGKSGGQALDPALAARYGAAYGADLTGVRVHRDSEEAVAMGARAFAMGEEVAFAPGEYQPGTPEGDHLLAHELAHVVQQSRGEAGVQRAGGVGPAEAEADKAASVAVGGGAVGGLSAAPPGAPQLAPKGTRAPEEVAPGEVDLGSGSFLPGPETEQAIQAAGQKGALVNVKLASVASGQVRARVDRRGAYRFVGDADRVPITGGPLSKLTGLAPHLALSIGKENVVTGFVTPQAKGGASAFAQLMRGKEGPASLGWAAVSHLRGIEVQNTFTGGTLTVSASGFSARFGNLVDGTASFSIDNAAYSFDATLDFSTDRFKGFQPGAAFEIHRSPEGKFTGAGTLSVALGGLTTTAKVSYHDGQVDLQGTLAVQKGSFSGSVTLLWADPGTIRDAVHRSVPAENLKTPPGAPPAGATPGPRQLAGMGTVTANISEWLAGEVTVIVDGVGNVTVVGEFAPPAEVTLFPQKDYTRELFKVEARAKYGVPVIGNVFVFANASLSAVAKIGPLKIYKIRAAGVFSTDSTIAKSFSISASLNMSAFAGLKLRLEGGVGLEILGHDIKAGVGVEALAGIQGYVEATPTIGVRERSSGGPEFYLDGHIELAARPVLILSGDLFVQLDSPWWSPAPDKTWKWPLGSIEYGLPGEFGIAADVSYVFGSSQLPEVKFGEVDFDASKFTTDLMNDHPAGASGGEKKKAGAWGEGKGGDPKGKGKGKGGGDDTTNADLPPEARWTGPIGDVESFSADGESHRTWIKDVGESATIMVASSPASLDTTLADYTSRVAQLPKKDAGDAKRRITAARNLGKKLDKDADKLAALKAATKSGKGKVKPSSGKKPAKGKKTNAAALNRQIKAQQRKLAGALSGLARLFRMIAPTAVTRPVSTAGGSETLTMRMSGKKLALFVGGQKLDTLITKITTVLSPAHEQAGRNALSRVVGAVKGWAQVSDATVFEHGKLLKRRYAELERLMGPVAKALSSFALAVDVSTLARATRVLPERKAYRAVVNVPKSVSATYEALVRIEARRQLDNQAEGMNKLTLDQWMTNVNSYKSQVLTRFNRLHADGRRAVLSELNRRLQAATSRIAPTEADLRRAEGLVSRLLADWDAGRPISAKRLRTVLTDSRVAKFLGRHGDEKQWRDAHSKGSGGGGVGAAHRQNLDWLETQLGLAPGSLRSQILAELTAAQAVAATQAKATHEISKLSYNLKNAILHNPDQYFGGKGKIPPASVVPKPAGTPPPGVALPPAWQAWTDYVNGLVPLVGVRSVNSAIGNNRTGWGPNIDRIVREVRAAHKKRGSWALWKMKLIVKIVQ